MTADALFQAPDQGSLLDLLDAVLDRGIVVHGELILSVAGVDLVYVGLHAVVASAEKMLQAQADAAEMQREAR